MQPHLHIYFTYGCSSSTYGCSLLHIRLQVLAFQSQLVGNVDLAIPGRLFVRQASLIKLSRDGPTTYAAHLLYQLTSLVVCTCLPSCYERYTRGRVPIYLRIATRYVFALFSDSLLYAEKQKLSSKLV